VVDISRFENWSLNKYSHPRLKSGFYESSKGVAADNVHVVCAGVPRSATTWAYQVAREIHPWGGVIKTHSWLDLPGVPVFLSVRDPRDVAVSYWRCMNKKNGNSPLRREDVVYVCGAVKLWFSHLRMYMSVPGTSLCRYERFIDNADEYMDRMLDVFGVSMDAWTRERIIRKYSYAVNCGLKLFTDTVTSPRHLHHMIDASVPPGPVPNSHVHEGEQGIWEWFIRPKDVDLFNMILEPELTEFGYE
jgi:hypothetical protein